jgi:glucose-6-phosphate dehydrogenase assembly protein OpcA
MAPAVTERWRSVATEDIDTSLADLWMEAARDNPVSRALMSNLVVVCRWPQRIDPETAHLGTAFDIVHIVERHPARVIFLNDVSAAAAPGASKRAAIGVLTFGEGTGRYGIEMMAIDAACAGASVPSIVRRFTQGDVPTTLWWTADLSRVRPPNAMVETGRQLLYDSAGWQDIGQGARWAAEIMALPRSPDLADLNWQRVAPLRWAIVLALRNEPRIAGTLAREAAVRHCAADRAAAWLLAGWLQRGMQWKTLPTREESDEAAGKLTVTLTSDRWTLKAAMNQDRIVVETNSGQSPFTMPVPQQTPAGAVIAELRNLGRDLHLRQTITALAQPASR